MIRVLVIAHLLRLALPFTAMGHPWKDLGNSTCGGSGVTCGGSGVTCHSMGFPNTPTKTNIEPENGPLGKGFSFSTSSFSGSMLIFRGVLKGLLVTWDSRANYNDQTAEVTL